LQTNGTLINSDWVTLFRKFGFSVGLSIDGSPESHDRYRSYHNGDGSYSSVVRAIRLLRDEGIRFGTITVIDPSLNGREVFKHHYNLGIRKMDFNLPILTHRTFEEQYSSGAVDRFTTFMCDIFDAWIDQDDPDVEVRTLASLVRQLVGGWPGH